jgi:hypothetical protein
MVFFHFYPCKRHLVLRRSSRRYLDAKRVCILDGRIVGSSNSTRSTLEDRKPQEVSIENEIGNVLARLARCLPTIQVGCGCWTLMLEYRQKPHVAAPSCFCEGGQIPRTVQRTSRCARNTNRTLPPISRPTTSGLSRILHQGLGYRVMCSKQTGKTTHPHLLQNFFSTQYSVRIDTLQHMALLPVSPNSLFSLSKHNTVSLPTWYSPLNLYVTNQTFCNSANKAMPS